MPSELKRERDVAEAEVPEMPKKKKSKKEKKNKEAASEAASDAASTAAATSPEAESKKEKKKKKKEKKEKKAEAAAATTEAAPTTTTVAVVKKSSMSAEETAKWYSDNNITLDGVEMSKFAPCLDFSHEQTGFTKKICDFIRTEKPTFKTPSLIQSTCWPLLMTGRDVFGIAKTGSGKTLAFFLPFLAQSEQGLLPSSKFNKAKNKPRMVIVAPTKELAQQTAEVCVEFTKNNVVDGNYPVCCIIGGVPKYQQAQQVKSTGADIVVATSGRLLDVVENDRLLDLSDVQFLVLDEADRMLDMGFIGDMRKLAALCPKEKRQTLLFSATWPAEVNKLARSLIGSPAEKRLKYEVATVTAGRRKNNDEKDGKVMESDINCEDPLSLNDAITQEVKVIENDRVKWDLLMEALKKHGQKKIVIFGLYKKEVARVEQWLLQTGYNVVALQGDMTQDKRTKAITDFKSNKIRMLIATDVAGRGLDIPDVEVVINYTMPLTMEDFVHRCGRTGRAGRSGRAISFFNVNGEHCEKEKVFPLIRLLEGARQPVPEKLSTLNKTTFTATKKKAHSVYGNFYKSPEEMAALEKKKVALTFDDSDSD